MTLKKRTTAQRADRWRCAACGERTSSVAAAQRHVDTEHGGGARFDLVLDQGKR